jgi:hypothetical protein
MLRLSNQLRRFDLISVLHDPLALIERLETLAVKRHDVPAASAKHGQLYLFA